jgi:hypothetical protein
MMTFHAYRASPFSHAHENHAFNHLHDLLQTHWAQKDEPIRLLGNFYVDGCEIDALILKRNAVIVIDFKDYGGRLEFSENNCWLIDGKAVRGGSKTNPFHQIRDNRFQLMKYLKSNIEFQSSPNLGHIAGLCLFHQDIEFSASTIPPNISRWFHVADMGTAIRSTDAIVSSCINFSDADIDSILAKLDVPVYHPDGRPVEVPIPSPEECKGPSKSVLNQEQSKAVVQIGDWLSDTEAKVFSLSGCYYSGKTKVLEKAIQLVENHGKAPLCLAPNARIANRYKARGFPNTQSVYSWLYAGRPNEVKNGKASYPLSHEPVKPDQEVIVIFDSHLLGDELFETETTVYGSGYVLRDLITALRGSAEDKSDNQAALRLSEIPKIIVIGDPYQLTRGAKDKSLLSCHIFEQRGIACTHVELGSQDRNDEAPVERLDFQHMLLGQIKAQKFTQLPICQQNSIKTFVKGEHTDSIAGALLQWPRRTTYLCATNEKAQAINSGIRRKYLQAGGLGALVKGDIVDVHNRTRNLKPFESGEPDWVGSGEFARVLAISSDTESKSITLNGRDEPVTVLFATADIELSAGTAEILYLPDFLSAPKPELTQDQVIALQIWARQDAEKKLAGDKAKLEEMDKQHSNYDAARRGYQEKLQRCIMSSKYTNAARLRYAYALTVHRAQAYEPMPRVVLDARSAHDTDNSATDSYFRWLYTATVCTSDAIEILDYPELTPLSKALWSFSEARHVPIAFKKPFYFEQGRVPTDEELVTPLPAGFSKPDSRLVALLLTVYEKLQETDWSVENITQHNYKERYLLVSDRGEVAIDFDYNGKYEVSIGKISAHNEDLAHELQSILSTSPLFKDKNVEEAVSLFTDHLGRKDWRVISSAEKNYKAFLIADNENEKVKLELNIPSDSSVSKKGVISSIKLVQADSRDIADKFESDFAHG